MRLLSQVFQPLVTIPKNAKIKSTEITCKSQKLLLECGLIRPTSSGLFAILPLARRALEKLEAHIRSCIESAGAQRISLPLLTPSPLWEATGRLEEVGPELMRVTDRHKKEYLLAPTHEEAIADLLADVGPLSYKQLPLLLYQITNKYRDEHRPKHGLLRAREFSMLDAYGIHTDEDCARREYASVGQAFKRAFAKLKVDVFRVQAAPGSMGGSLSHEWQLPTASGEDTVHLCQQCRRECQQCRRCQCGGQVQAVCSTEVAHTFILGTRYTEPLKALITNKSSSAPALMSCYGIGVTRLMAACVDSLATENELRWPKIIAPYSALVIGPKEGSKEWLSHGWSEIQNVHNTLSQVTSLNHDIMVDDRHGLTIGKRLMQANRMGYPNVIVCGRSSINQPPLYELVTPSSEPKIMSLQEICTFIENDNLNDVDVDCDDNIRLQG